MKPKQNKPTYCATCGGHLTERRAKSAVGRHLTVHRRVACIGKPAEKPQETAE